ncbi:MAG TPA: hypothetical protein VHJ20_14385 [Polyangia bacterium]|nr:hypothetical protein [Polyangia bacterium]
MLKTISTLVLAAAFLLTRPAFAGEEAPKDEKAAKAKKADKKEEKKEDKKADKGGW